ncbi:hypothetical protein F5Y04DRAFT_278649 [Hypomontagnella monticulosa]|nr:hypothetical protein F5Y04DRAFT_278649 [Hypomontagnella monticulosa]
MSKENTPPVATTNDCTPNAPEVSVDDTSVSAAPANGGAYSFALSVKDLTGATLEQTLHVYTEAMRIVWFVGLAFALLGSLLVFAEKHVDMRITLETEFGLEGAKEAKEIESAERGITEC